MGPGMMRGFVPPAGPAIGRGPRGIQTWGPRPGMRDYRRRGHRAGEHGDEDEERNDEQADFLEDLLEHPAVRGLLSLMEKNMDLRTEIAVAEVRMKAQQEIHEIQMQQAQRHVEELERAVRAAEERAQEAAAQMHAMHEHMDDARRMAEEARTWPGRIEELSTENRRLHEMLEHRDRQLRDVEQALERSRNAQAATEAKLRELLAKVEYLADKKRKAAGKKEE